ncbi:chromosomal replication initiation ATPase DnaA [Bradyrhizobium japonicum]
MSYLIWSVEHAAWWAPAGLGYTTATHRAGLYELEEATGIVTEANRGPHLSEIMVPAPQPSQIDHDLTCDLSWPEAQRAGRVDAALAKQLSRSIANNCELQNRVDHAVSVAKRLEDRVEELNGALGKIAQWAKAYPLDVFPEPDLVKAHALLEAGGITLDSISTHCMRHVIEGVGQIADRALEGKP